MSDRIFVDPDGLRRWARRARDTAHAYRDLQWLCREPLPAMPPWLHSSVEAARTGICVGIAGLVATLEEMAAEAEAAATEAEALGRRALAGLETWAASTDTPWDYARKVLTNPSELLKEAGAGLAAVYEVLGLIYERRRLVIPARPDVPFIVKETFDTYVKPIARPARVLRSSIKPLFLTEEAWRKIPILPKSVRTPLTLPGTGDVESVTQRLNTARAGSAVDSGLPLLSVPMAGVSQWIDDSHDSHLTGGQRFARASAAAVTEGVGAAAGYYFGEAGGEALGAGVGAIAGAIIGGGPEDVPADATGAVIGKAVGGAVGGVAGSIGGGWAGEQAKKGIFAWNPDHVFG